MAKVKQEMITTQSDKYPPTSTTNVCDRVGWGLIVRDTYFVGDVDSVSFWPPRPDPSAGRVGQRVRKVEHL
jgi:hypothetical protein